MAGLFGRRIVFARFLGGIVCCCYRGGEGEGSSSGSRKGDACVLCLSTAVVQCKRIVATGCVRYLQHEWDIRKMFLKPPKKWRRVQADCHSEEVLGTPKKRWVQADGCDIMGGGCDIVSACKPQRGSRWWCGAGVERHQQDDRKRSSSSVCDTSKYSFKRASLVGAVETVKWFCGSLDTDTSYVPGTIQNSILLLYTDVVWWSCRVTTVVVLYLVVL